MRKLLTRCLPSAVLAAEIALAADIAGILLKLDVPCTVYCGVFAVLFLLFSCRKRKTGWRIPLYIAAPFVLALCVLAVYGLIFRFTSDYKEVDNGKSELYAGRKVLLIVPHQDDEINVLGGVTDEYIKYGSEVFVCYTTNGDYRVDTEQRFNEAISVLELSGVPEKNIIFLGYGDRWRNTSLYNAAPDDKLISVAGREETYGASYHQSYTVGKPYTRKNFCEDLKNLICELSPDVIYCVGYDKHSDHMTACMIFDEVMGQILKENSGYRPRILYGRAYSTAYDAESDFYSENILSTQNPYYTEYVQPTNFFMWNERVRMPVNASMLSRSLSGSKLYKQIAMHRSQVIYKHAEGIINGDKVFWGRECTSESYGANVSVSSGNASLLNDFRLMHTDCVTDFDSSPFGAVWIPEADDAEKSARLSFDAPIDIESILIYDNPSLDDNVLRLEISFDDGSVEEAGPLNKNGSPTRIDVGKRDIRELQIRITDAEGAKAGLNEIEVYSQMPAHTHEKFIKLQNMRGDFVYDYYIDRSGVEEFEVYKSGIDSENYIVRCSGKDCSASIDGDRVSVSCPHGRSCVVTVETEDGRFSDSAYFSNPDTFKRTAGQAIENKTLWKSVYRTVSETFIYKSARDAYRIVRFGTTEIPSE